MRKIYTIFIIFTLTSCQLTNEEKKESISFNHNESITISKDTIRINKDIVLFVDTMFGLDSLKNTFKNLDDFYTMADDANYYMSEAQNFIKNKQIDTLSIVDNKIIIFDNRDTINSKKLPLWSLVLYSKGKNPKIIYPIDISNEYDKYFGRSK